MTCTHAYAWVVLDSRDLDVDSKINCVGVFLCTQTKSLPFYLVLCVQYFLPFGLGGINKLIEQAIVDADKAGVKVISLAALNKVKFEILMYTFMPN